MIRKPVVTQEQWAQSRMCRELDEEAKAFRERPLDEEVPYVWLDAVYEEVRDGGQVRSRAVVLAIGVTASGHRQVLGIEAGSTESEAFWRDFLRSLVRRGLKGVELAISDAHVGIREAVKKVLPTTTWQRCRVRHQQRHWELHHLTRRRPSQPFEEKQSYAAGTAYTKTVTRQWDEVGNKATEAYPSGLSLAYTWTDVNQLASISDGTNTVASWTYGGLRTKQVDYQNGTKTLLSYTGYRGEVGTIHHKTSSNATVLQLDYGYDANHDRLYERYGGSSAAGDAFAYDTARRLTTAWMGSVTPTTPTTVAYTTKIEYAMDDDGNRTSVVTTPYGSSPATTSYTTNSLNQYTAVGGTSRSHDGNGNVADDGTYTYEYNYKNLICRVKQGSTTVGEYKYNALGRRVEKAVTGATYRYIYSGLETVCVYTSTGTWKQDFVYDAGIDGIVMLQQADVLDQDGDANTSETTRSFYHRNALGSVLEITDMSQAKAVSYRYDPYGQITITRGGSTQSNDPLGQRISFQARMCDEELGDYYLRNRVCSPSLGRFVQRDPLGVPAGSNLYTLVGSCPTMMRDPLGLDGDRDAPQPGGYDKPGGFDDKGAEQGQRPFFIRSGDLWFRLHLYFWTPNGSQGAKMQGLYVKSEVLVLPSGCKVSPGVTAACPSPRLTIEYFRIGENGHRTEQIDTHQSNFMTGYCAGTVTVSMTLTIGILIVRDPGTGEWGKGGSYVLESAAGYSPSGPHSPVGAANTFFIPATPSSTWRYTFSFDDCSLTPARSRCGWDRMSRPPILKRREPVITPN